ncbi:endonuclease/exonuclease/phosphatase family protein [Paenibacillus lemnae]|uniref:Endonuclease/exonuclease/phosphatase family protein n=1 Tax=Paenibacillus lemnae TaxID=1330551 RepID=A0A848M8N6_PAELE|nr:endonuclease/exonuclease/phosphatase family protein [Paenibacillus lemnae]NMO96442.1 endonuclease/exonuclease/phosphatase family protein [Paenibacillus lemnae]
MKIMTLNTHSWQEEQQMDKIKQLAAFIHEHDIDVISLQEVNQSMGAEAVPHSRLTHYRPAEQDIVIREDNYAYILQRELKTEYYWTWVPVHVGFVTYDEGLAILSKMPIQQTMSHYVSAMRDYSNYRTRKILGIQASMQGMDTWFVNGHYGWWEDEESFRGQWDRTEEVLAGLRQGRLFIMGDFNNVAERRGEGYDYLMNKGWHDLYLTAADRDEGFTVVKAIAGWEDNKRPLRIDYICSSHPVSVLTSRVVMNGERGPVVSDHFGVMVEIEGK